MSVTLRTEILPTDLTAMMRWLANPHVSDNLNEHEQITAQLHQIYDAQLPVLTPLFNQNGRFWMIDPSFERPVGFLHAVYGAENSVEMVIAIGDEALWGRGLGKKALQAALKEIFLEMRKESIWVHIKHGNTRSHNLFMNSGFSFVQERTHTTQYALTFDDYLHPHPKQSAAARAQSCNLSDGSHGFTLKNQNNNAKQRGELGKYRPSSEFE